MSPSSFLCRPFVGTFENAQCRKVKYMQPVWLYIHSGRQFDATFETPTEGKSGLQVVEGPAFQKHSTLWVFSALAVPGSAFVCHDLPHHRLPQTATDWLKCFCIYRLKCSKAVSGVDGMGLGWKSLKAPLLWAPLCGANDSTVTILGTEPRHWHAVCSGVVRVGEPD